MNFLKVSIAAALTAVSVSACGDKEISDSISLPLTISCGKSQPSSWEDGDIFNLLENGTASMSSKVLLSRGIVSVVGTWKTKNQGYTITWNGGVSTDGELIALTPPGAHEIVKLVASDNKNMVEMRLPKESRYCLVGE